MLCPSGLKVSFFLSIAGIVLVQSKHDTGLGKNIQKFKYRVGDMSG